MLKLGGWSPAVADDTANLTMALETELARISYTREERHSSADKLYAVPLPLPPPNYRL